MDPHAPDTLRNHAEPEVAARFAAVSLTGDPAEMAAGCADAARDVLGCRLRLVLPVSQEKVQAGDSPEGLALAARFPVAGGEGELWADPAAGTASAVVPAVVAQVVRVWELQRERLARSRELERLRFELGALQQVARTLNVVRGVGETERLVLDSIGEIFFAWWAALYRTEPGGETYHCRAVRALRGEILPDTVPAAVVHDLARQPTGPLAPPADAAIRAHVPADLALTIPLDLGEGGTGLLLLGPRISVVQYTADDLALLRALADSSAVALRNEDLVERLRVQALVDALTGCHNRRGFDEILELEFARARRYDRPLSLVLLDIDNFKSVNDALGHDAGDHALRRVGEALRAAFRITDSTCRYGGEEFGILMPETAWPESIRPAERLRSLIASLFPDDHVPCHITASLGLAAFPDHASAPGELVRAADQALYRAKVRGRNRIETA